MSRGGVVVANPVEITGPSGNIGDFNDSGQFNITDRQFLSSHKNHHDSSLTLTDNRNTYSTGITKIDSGVTVTIPANGNYYILRP